MHQIKHVTDKVACAYAAGLMDGEGYISIHKQKSYCSGNSYLRMKIMISMCETTGLRYIQKTWGGRAHILKNGQANGGENNRPILRWYLIADNASSFLQDILPYLKVKRPHAELAIAFQNNIAEHRGWHSNRRGMPEDRRAFLHAMYLRMAELNKRGTNHTGLSSTPDSDDQNEMSNG